VVEIGKDFFGQLVWDDLQREQVSTEFVVGELGERTAVSVLLISGEGGRSALTYRGASSMLEARDIPWEDLKQTRWIHLSNVSANIELLSNLFDQVRKTNVGLSWNPGKKELEALAAGGLNVDSIACDILVMNKEEWAVVAAQQSVLLQHIPQIVVTDGRNGGEVYVKGQHQHHYAIQKVQAIQETGAGDAFTVGFVAGNIWRKTVEEACQFGVMNAAHVVQHMDAKSGLLTKEQLHV
jgi:sugar/nucleoside kinase (ribokinase family)